MPTTNSIKKSDTVCHWVFDPKHFGAIPECLKLGGKIQFNSNCDYSVSVNSKDLCSNFPTHIHNLGEEQAAKLTERNQMNGREITETYRGFLPISVNDVENIEADNHNFVVVHDPIEADIDNGVTENLMHCNIKLSYPSDLSKPNSSKRKFMTERLVECLSVPLVEKNT